MNKKLRQEILKQAYEIRYKSIHWIELFRIFEKHYPQFAGQDDKNLHKIYIAPGFFDWDNPSFAKDAPPQLMAEVEHLKGHGLIKVETPCLGQIIPDIRITAKGEDFIERPCWLIRILKKGVEKFIINFTCFILGIIVGWFLHLLF